MSWCVVRGYLMSDGYDVDTRSVRTLSSVLTGRGTDLQSVADRVRHSANARNADVTAGLSFARQVWAQAVHVLGEGITLAAGKVDTAIRVYEQADHTVGTAATNATNTPARAGF